MELSSPSSALQVDLKGNGPAASGAVVSIWRQGKCDLLQESRDPRGQVGR